MGFKILVDGEQVHETEEEGYRVEAILVGTYKVPVGFDEDEINLVLLYKSDTDAEVIEKEADPVPPATKEEAEKENPPKTKEELDAEKEAEKEAKDAEKSEKKEEKDEKKEEKKEAKDEEKKPAPKPAVTQPAKKK